MNSFINSVKIIEREAGDFCGYVSKLVSVYESYNYHKIYSRLYSIRNKTLVPFIAYYSCGSNNLSLKNSFPASPIAVLNREYVKLNTSVNAGYINFTVDEKKYYSKSKNICIFEGYICVGCSSNAMSIVGDFPYDVMYLNHSQVNVSTWLLYLQNHINDNFLVGIENDTIVYYNQFFSNYLK